MPSACAACARAARAESASKRTAAPPRYWLLRRTERSCAASSDVARLVTATPELRLALFICELTQGMSPTSGASVASALQGSASTVSRQAARGTGWGFHGYSDEASKRTGTRQIDVPWVLLQGLLRPPQRHPPLAFVYPNSMGARRRKTRRRFGESSQSGTIGRCASGSAWMTDDYLPACPHPSAYWVFILPAASPLAARTQASPRAAKITSPRRRTGRAAVWAMTTAFSSSAVQSCFDRIHLFPVSVCADNGALQPIRPPLPDLSAPPERLPTGLP